MIIQSKQFQNQSYFFPFSSSVKEDHSTIDNSLCPFDVQLGSSMPLKFKWMIMEYLIEQKMIRARKECLSVLVQHANAKKQFAFRRMASFSKNAEEPIGVACNIKPAPNRKLSLFQILTLQIQNIKKDQSQKNKKVSNFALTSPQFTHKKTRTASRTLAVDNQKRQSNSLRPSICNFVRNNDNDDEIQDKMNNDNRRQSNFTSTNNIYASLINIIENKSSKKKSSRFAYVDDEDQTLRKSKRSLTSVPKEELKSVASFKDSYVERNHVSTSKISLLCIFSTLKAKIMNLQLVAFSQLRFYQNTLLASPQEQKNYIKRSLDLLEQNLQKDEQIMELHEQLQLKRNQIQAMQEQLNILKNSMKFNIFYKLEQLWKSHLITGFNMIVARQNDSDSQKINEHSSTKFDEISEIVIKTPSNTDLQLNIKDKTLIYLDQPDNNPSHKIIDSDASIDYEGMCSFHNLVERDGFQQKSAVLSDQQPEND